MRPRLAAAALAGVALALAFPPYDLWPLAFPAVAALSLLVRDLSPRRSAAVGFVYALACLLTMLRWLHVIGWDAMIVLSLLEAAFYAPAAALMAWCFRYRAWPFLHASCWVLVEALRSRYPLGGFPWGKLAFGVVDSPLAALASVGGTPLVTGAVALVGAALAAAFLAVRDHRVRPAGLGVAGVLVGCVACLAIPLPTSGGTTTTVALVQGNTPRAGLTAIKQREAVFVNHLNATHALAEDIRAGRVPAPQMVIWPENASDLDPYTIPIVYTRMNEAVQDVGVDTLIGTVLDDPPNHLTNTAIVWSPTGGPGERYTKRKLVPFGEYIPMRDLMTKFIGRLDLVPRDFRPGTRSGVLDIGGTRIGDVICFEVAFDSLVRESVRDGGKLLVIQTNNATYGHTGQPEQQLAISRLRAIESGRAVVIAATSGISGVIRPDGSVEKRTKEFTQETVVATVPLRSAQTLATRLGAWAELVLCAPVVLLAAPMWLRRLTRRRTAGPVTVASP